MVVGDTNAILYCNLISQTFTRDRKVRCSRIFLHPTALYNKVFERFYYVSVEKPTFRDIMKKLVYTVGYIIVFKDSKTAAKAVLHFRRVLQW